MGGGIKALSLRERLRGLQIGNGYSCDVSRVEGEMLSAAVVDGGGHSSSLERVANFGLNLTKFGDISFYLVQFLQ